MSSSGVSATPSVPQPAPRSRRKRILVFAFIAGVALLAFVTGAAVVFFQLPTSQFLAKGFIGFRAWFERTAVSPPAPGQDLPPVSLSSVDKPVKTFDGFTLSTYSAINGVSTQAYLLDMHGKVKHRWAVPFSKIWPKPDHVPTPVKDSYVSFFGCHLYPNGDLLAVLHGVQKSAVGYGLVKLDKDSNVIWSYPARIHHSIDVAPDGTIYTLQHETVNSLPLGLQYIPAPCLVDYLIALNPDGTLKNKPLPLLEAFRDSPYAVHLHSLEPNKKQDNQSAPLTLRRFDEETRRQDALHTNTIQVLTPSMAQKFPEWKAGQLLLTMRNLDSIAVVDPERRTVVWAARGPWQALHDAQFLDNGNLLLFDNLGLAKGSRVIEYDPRTQAFPWVYSGENWGPFFTSERGMCQRLPNGNTLAVNSKAGEILEVSRQKEVVWSFSPQRFIAYARRFTAEQVPFLPPGEKPRGPR
jgi:hypothetical protein